MKKAQPSTPMNKRIRYEDLNWRVVTDYENKLIWFEKSNEDVMGEKSWTKIGSGTRRALLEIDDVDILDILWTLLDRYTLDSKE